MAEPEADHDLWPTACQEIPPQGLHQRFPTLYYDWSRLCFPSRMRSRDSTRWTHRVGGQLLSVSA